MTAGHNPVQDRIDHLEAAEDRARELLERALHLAGRQLDRDAHTAIAPTLRLAVVFHRRADAAAADLASFINYLERDVC
ncbi:hypothetical protein SNOUR_41905 [Streptomyces noursei ATCC 11455]|uniref:hypothetical protein n=1 Tax=Streptomyces noursei TaxID=1971 RepID=UPI00081D332C|nr:hypothetical protein SNOUR_41905 [Streptomyces noursei ATCC 11455]